MRSPDIELTEAESQLFLEISSPASQYDEICRSIDPMDRLAQSLIARGAIPNVRLLYFTDPARNPTGRGKSREEIFIKNGTAAGEIFRHPNFMDYLKYFICGPDLPDRVIQRFREMSTFSGRLTGSDALELMPYVRATVRSEGLAPYEAAIEFHKLALECGASTWSADSIRKTVRSIKIN